MVNLSLFPNLLFVGNQLMVVEPLAVDRTRLTMYLVAGAGGAGRRSTCCGCGSTRTSSASARRTTSTCSSGCSAGLRDPRDGVDRRQPRARRRDDVDEPDGVIVGPITSEAPQRGYLADYARLMRDGGDDRAR